MLKQIESAEPAFLSPHHYLAIIYLDTKQYAEYVAESRTMAVLSHNPGALEITEAAEKGLGRGSESMLEQMAQVQKKLYAQGREPAFSLAKTCSLLGEKQAAMEYLRAGYEKRESLMLGLRTDPELRNLM